MNGPRSMPVEPTCVPEKIATMTVGSIARRDEADGERDR